MFVQLFYFPPADKNSAVAASITTYKYVFLTSDIQKDLLNTQNKTSRLRLNKTAIFHAWNFPFLVM